MKLSNVTFTLSNPNPTLEKQLTWCNTVPKAKRNKVVKLNGIRIGDADYGVPVGQESTTP